MRYPKGLLFAAVVLGVLAAFWPQLEVYLVGEKCPWYDLLYTKTDDAAPVAANLFQMTEEDLRKYDGSDPELPIYLSIDGKILDVTSGIKFYGKGATYNQFAGRACTRALSLTSLEEKDISDDVSDFSEAQIKEMEERIDFYVKKYKQVGILDRSSLATKDVEENENSEL